MSEARGPITLITSISDQRNKWKALAYAWKGVAMRAVHSCSQCGDPALWHHGARGEYWCEDHWRSAQPEQKEGAEKVAWHAGLLKAMDLEDRL